MSKKIVITSGKGGVGKTTVTANLGIALAIKKKRVLLCDLDFGLNNLDVVMGVENKITYDLGDVLSGKCRVKQALVEDKRVNGLYVLPSTSLSSFSEISGQSIKLLLDGLSPYFDYVLIDCPAGVDNGFYRALACADSAIVVVTPSLTSIRDAYKCIEIIEKYKIELSIIINRARGDLMMGSKMLLPEDISEVLKAKLLGVLPEEDAVFLSTGRFLPKNADSFKAYKMIADNIVFGKSRVFDATKKYSGFFGSIRRRIKQDI